MGDARVTPLDDEQLLEAVRRALREIVLPELEAAGADEFVVSQVRSVLSIVGFVARGLGERQLARSEADRALGEAYDRHQRASTWTRATAVGTGRFLAEPGEDGQRTAATVHRILRERLAAELSSRTARRPD